MAESDTTSTTQRGQPPGIGLPRADKSLPGVRDYSKDWKSLDDNVKNYMSAVKNTENIFDITKKQPVVIYYVASSEQ
jgi:hypothetical protein